MKREFNEIEQVRREKVAKFYENNLNPFENSDFSIEKRSLDLHNSYNAFSKNELEGKAIETVIAGRVMAMRGPFLVLKDGAGQIQLYVAKENLKGKSATIANLLDIGDIIAVRGILMKTNTNVLAIRVNELWMLTKSLRPLPEKYHGLKDVEERYRHRYVDLIMNEDVFQTFTTRSKIIHLIRSFMNDLAYLEVETPILHAILGGAAARPFTTHHNALGRDFYLRIATELPLKKLLVGGMERVYEIGRIFRNEGIDTTHNPEFTSIEFYESYANLEVMMTRTEAIFSYIAQALEKDKIIYNNKEISLKTPFKRLNMVDAISEKLGVDFRKISLEEAMNLAKKHKIKLEPYFKLGHIINEFFEVLIEDTLIDPTFVYGHPIEISPLAAKNAHDPRFTDRAELFIDGREYANMFTEIHDPIDQLDRLEKQLAERESGNDEANEIDDDFIEALEYGMPPAGGCGIGIDRLVMLFTNSLSIRDVLLFPHLKDNKGKEVK